MAYTIHLDAENDIAARTMRALTKRVISANYTLVLADALDVVLHVTATTAITITLPSDASVAIGQEIRIPWRQYGVGQITFVAGAGATVVNRLNAFRSARPYAQGRVVKVDVSTWLLEGELMV